jgi:acetaldehyde dehydrogenase (acetylating)
MKTSNNHGRAHLGPSTGSKLRAVIIGSGNIGTDLLVKTLRSKYLEAFAFVGRTSGSDGLKRAAELGVRVSDGSLQFLIDHADDYDLVFDATSASAHEKHAIVLAQLKKPVIDLTPAKVGMLCVPAVNGAECLTALNLNMITCGGQASIPIAYAIGTTQKNVEYIEVISSIASKSAGPATRANLDEYIHTTEIGISQFSGVARAKAILNLNPAVPCIDMQTTVFAKMESPNLEALKPALDAIVDRVRAYVPGYRVIVGPTIENGRLVVMVRVRGLGDYLPSYAGNLDIINCAAVGIAERRAQALLAAQLEVSL